MFDKQNYFTPLTRNFTILVHYLLSVWFMVTEGSFFSVKSSKNVLYNT